jgi:hypothetical protein
MYGELYQYLILHQQLDLPGIGSFRVEKTPASFDFANKIINPPVFTIALQAEHKTPAKSFFSWLAGKLGISEREAVIRFNDFLFDTKQQLSAGHTMQWPGIGSISKGLADATRFETALKEYSPASAVTADKILRENTEHLVRVGEQEKVAMGGKRADYSTEIKRSRWWIAPLAIIVLGVGFLIYYFSVHGFHTASVSNGQKMIPQAGA